MVYGKSSNTKMDKLAKRLKQKGISAMVTNQVERDTRIIYALEVGTSMKNSKFVIEYEEPYEARVSSTVP